MYNNKIKTVLFAHAGGSALSYISVLASLARKTALIPADLPGHGARMNEELLHDTRSMAGDAARSIASATDGRCAVFGHSLGGMLAYLGTLLLFKRGLPLPDQLILSSCHTPGHFRMPEDSYLRPDCEFLKIVERHGTLPKILFESEETRRTFLPILRADFEAILTTPVVEITPLPVPVTLIAANGDDYSYAEQMAWRRCSSVSFRIRRLQGKHFYFLEDSAPLCSLLEELLNL